MHCILIFIFSIAKIYSSEVCKFSVSCSNDLENQCAIKTKTESNEVYQLLLHPCEFQEKNLCNIYDNMLSQSSMNSSCYLSNQVTPSYPGGACKSEVECLYGICVKGVCVDSEMGNFCSIDNNCPIGTSCINNRCRPYKKDGEDCLHSTNCKFNSVCFQGTCRPQFFASDGTNIGNINNFLQKNEIPENFCQTGGYYLNEKNEVICATLFNKEQTCREDCTYTVGGTGNLIFVSDRCYCGYNKERSKFCILGNGEEPYRNFLNMKKEFINNETMTKYCHTTERSGDDICVELKKRERSVSFRKYVQNYNNMKILAKEHHRLQNSDDCVKSAIFGYDTSPVIPDKMSCPSINCDDKIAQCIEGFNPFNENGDNIKVSMNDKVCKGDEICLLKKSNSIASVFQYQNSKGQCEKVDSKVISRFPGEDCDNTTVCVVERSNCTNGKCTGRKEGDECEDHQFCNVGLFCSKDPQNEGKGVCTKQKEEGEICQETWDCVNYLGCYHNRCSKYTILKKDSKIDSNDRKIMGKTVHKYYFCELGQLSVDETFCAEIEYAGETLAKKTKESDFVECGHDEACWYTDGKVTFKNNCGCGYNSEGKGYCPLPNSLRKDKWRERVQYYAEKTNNGCHSISRFSCYLSKKSKKERRIYAETDGAHLFNKAVPCAFKIFGKGHHIRVSYYFLIILYLFLM